MKRNLIPLALGAIALIPVTVYAQEYGLPHSMIQAYSGNAESQIIIRVKKSGDRSTLCTTRAGAFNDDYDFPRPGSGANHYDFPRPGGSNSFQLPTGASNPDIIGCVDRTRNIVFINILKAIENSPPVSESAPYNPNYSPNDRPDQQRPARSLNR